MRLPIVATAALLLAAPAAGLGQTMPGIDLSKPPPPKPSADAPPKPAEKPSSEAASPLGPSGERDVALGDRVKAVQRKGFLKRHRLEVTPFLVVGLNDAFYQKFGGGVRVGYGLADSFAIAARGVWYQPYMTDNVRLGKVAFESQLLTSQPSTQAMLDAVWFPIYGKAATVGGNIVHFDLSLSAGFGAVWSATSFAPRSEGPHPAADLGAALRFYPKEWLALELGLSGTFYTDRAVETLPGTVQRIVTANFGLSIYFPFSFEYVYP
jgi:outer membrane beta-barrel protein